MRKNLVGDFLLQGLGYHLLFSRHLKKSAGKTKSIKRELSVLDRVTLKVRDPEIAVHVSWQRQPANVLGLSGWGKDNASLSTRSAVESYTNTSSKQLQLKRTQKLSLIPWIYSKTRICCAYTAPILNKMCKRLKNDCLKNIAYFGLG